MQMIEHPGGGAQAVITSALEHLTAAGIRVEWRHETTLEGTISTGALLLDTGTTQYEFRAVASATVSSAGLTFLPHDEQTILLTRHITPARAQALAERGWGGYVDSTGNASLRSPGLLIEIAGNRDAGTTRTPAAAPFTRAGLPVTFALLIAHQQGRRVVQRDLAASSGASIGTVNRVVRALRERTPSMLDTSNLVLRPAALEDEWVVAYSAVQPTAWPETRFTSDVWHDPSDLLKADLPQGALLGSELAAAQLGAPIRPSEALVHLPPEARPEFIRQGRLRRSIEGPVRIRPTLWTSPPPGSDGLAPRPLLRADLLLEDDPRVDEIRAQLFGDA
ncbi:hypothetical protein CFK39_10510 [Brachybacterium avium]|uniref:Transcriptional regulator n=1 Tax=Brachybacterium avium TaxID=2017485 RepID=A0A220UDZ0_9MICO|nr:type IV toxin-antitoxin system AbiEi family antitoxin [Brachybacterium avium]ASK66171.1 hypothetical protein CFK39_10510 [Brachybacterium avium]